LHDLRQAWQGITPIDFTIEARETEPQLLQVMAPNEAVVAIGLEVRMAENSGMINIGMPSIIIKMLRQKFEQQWSVRRAQSTDEEQSRVLRLLKQGQLRLDARLEGPVVLAEDLGRLEAGDVVRFDFPVERPVCLLVNGKRKYSGYLVTTGQKRAFVVGEISQPSE
jgi:flagellar motor switch protein FliM